MQHLVEFEDNEVATFSTKQDVVVNEKQFIKCMKIKPFWGFTTLDRDSYLKSITNEKSTLRNWYYLSMESNSSAGSNFY